MSVTILTRDAGFNITGILQGWRSLSASPLFNDVGSWQVEFAAFPAASALMQPGCGVQIIRNGQLFMSGPVETISFAQDADQESYPGTFTVSGADDMTYLARRLVLPDPNSAVNSQGAATSYANTGAAGALMCDLVAKNVASSAPVTARAIPALTVAPSSLGLTVNLQERFTVVLDVLKSLALTGGGLGFRVVQVGRGLQFSVYQPRNLSTTARFSASLANLRTVTFAQSAPLFTRAIVGGAGTGTARPITQYVAAGTESSWSMSVESFVDDSSVTDQTVIAQDGASALAANGVQAQVTATIVESPTLRFGGDTAGVVGVGIGDMVSISALPDNSVQVVESVQQLTLTSDASGGELVSAAVGDSSFSTLPASVVAVKALDKRIANLEKT